VLRLCVALLGVHFTVARGWSILVPITVIVSLVEELRDVLVPFADQPSIATQVSIWRMKGQCQTIPAEPLAHEEVRCTAEDKVWATTSLD
jgi:hypothetical protein